MQLQVQKPLCASSLRLAGFKEDSTTDGPGIRFVVFAQGCPHNCAGCHNPSSHSFTDGGFYADPSKLAAKIVRSNTAGLTFSGGEPFCQAASLASVAHEVRRYKSVDLIVYTGYMYEELLSMANTDDGVHALLSEANYIVDGKFVESLKSQDWFFRGSSNQRILDVTCYPNSAKAREIVDRCDL
ncbi:anaerobic ribonucleoside-triphosphate reductase activating protein [Clostridia bacterium]|nr:anaerobic ribonucleoside-triphosphate reductase activating protein [Clostridia bacterium]